MEPAGEWLNQENGTPTLWDCCSKWEIKSTTVWYQIDKNCVRNVSITIQDQEDRKKTQ